MASHQVTGDMITNALVLMAIALVLTRTLGMGARAVSGTHDQVGIPTNA